MFILLFSSILAFHSQVQVPEKSISEHSLSVTISDKERIADWSEEDHSDSYHALQKIVRTWKEKKFASQFLIYGKVSCNTDFFWEVVPQFDCNSSITRFIQQCKTLWGVSFPKNSHGKYELELLDESSEEEELFGNDPFCKAEVIQKQWVWQGKSVSVLYNYRPIGIGNEKLHFLILPKKHRPTFYQLSEEEYKETLTIAQKLVQYFSEARTIHEAHLFHKSGKDAGQTVPHWHMHLILTTSDLQNCLGKVCIIRNMLLSPSPLNDEELAEKVTQYRDEIIPALQY